MYQGKCTLSVSILGNIIAVTFAHRQTELFQYCCVLQLWLYSQEFLNFDTVAFKSNRIHRFECFSHFLQNSTNINESICFILGGLFSDASSHF